MTFSIIKIILNTYILIDQKFGVIGNAIETLSFFALCNSLLWAFSIPKIICDHLF